MGSQAAAKNNEYAGLFKQLRGYDRDRTRLGKLQAMLWDCSNGPGKIKRAERGVSRLEGKMLIKARRIVALCGKNRAEFEETAARKACCWSSADGISNMSFFAAMASGAIGIVTLPNFSLVRAVDYTNPAISAVAWCIFAASFALHYVSNKIAGKAQAFYSSAGELLKHAEELLSKKGG